MIVYCTGRSVRGNPSPLNAPETIEETAEMVTARGGIGIAVQVDHTVIAEVEALFERVLSEQKRLDILVNNVSGADHLWVQPFWETPVEACLQAIVQGGHSHILATYLAARRMQAANQGLVVSISDADANPTLSYALEKSLVNRMVMGSADDLRTCNIATVSLVPGYMRTEGILREHGVTEENWRDAIASDPYFATSQTPHYTGRAVVALATDADVLAKTGCVLNVSDLGREYGFCDTDGRQP